MRECFYSIMFSSVTRLSLLGAAVLLLVRCASSETLLEPPPKLPNLPATPTAQAPPLETAPAETPAPKEESAYVYRIMLDPGHGGHDKGAQGFFQVSEKVIALKLSKMVKKSIEKKAKQNALSVFVGMTRTTDVFIPLRTRVSMANRWKADVFVSIHANAAPVSKPKGFELYFLSADATDAATANLAKKENQDKSESAKVKDTIQFILSDVVTTQHVVESSYFAHTLYRVMERTLKPNVRGVRQGPFTVLSGTHMPAILAEVGYVTNKQDAKNLKKESYLKQIANAISLGIIEYLKGAQEVG